MTNVVHTDAKCYRYEEDDDAGGGTGGGESGQVASTWLDEHYKKRTWEVYDGEKYTSY